MWQLFLISKRRHQGPLDSSIQLIHAKNRKLELEIRFKDTVELEGEISLTLTSIWTLSLAQGWSFLSIWLAKMPVLSGICSFSSWIYHYKCQVEEPKLPQPHSGHHTQCVDIPYFCFAVFVPSKLAIETAVLNIDQGDMASAERKMKALARNHIVAGNLTMEALIAKQESQEKTLITLEGTPLMLSKEADGRLAIGASTHIDISDLFASNGVAHVVDKVIVDGINEGEIEKEVPWCCKTVRFALWLRLIQASSLSMWASWSIPLMLHNGM